MRFKPLVAEEDLKRDEEEIAAKVREAAQATPVKQEQQCVDDTLTTQLRPEPRLEPIKAGAMVKLLAAVGLKRAMRRIETVNRITRTVDLGCKNGLYDPARKYGGREYAMAVKLHAKALQPRTPDEELFVILGWVQALVAMGCKGMTPDRAMAA